MEGDEEMRERNEYQLSPSGYASGTPTANAVACGTPTEKQATRQCLSTTRLREHKRGKPSRSAVSPFNCQLSTNK
jgi:hypothetical protein